MTKSKNVNLDFKKTIQISDALKANDVSMLKQLGRAPGGFINNDIRYKVWPRLLLSSADDNDVHDRASYGGKENGIFPEQNDENRKQAHGVTTESDIYKQMIQALNIR
ncbi:hypothetical protein LRAMOSA01019 [Lichtheimia ramosa]|uniref:Uncharacterized protein n=1 Tax=Lichtheimia ramosa TaxID=688394 RepID=A0A077W8C7_9FUNG|nr:hypothetical protein LRAMOSA01019 [Lichtheimia ramosa]